MTTDTPLLEVRDLKMYFPVQRPGFVSRLRGHTADVLKAVDGVNLTIRRGEALGLVGESGCGKSTLGRCIVGLYQPTDGQVLFDGAPVKLGHGKDATTIRRAQITFQDPYSSLNPRMTVRQTLVEAMRVHRIASGDALEARCSELLDLVRLGQRVSHAYPRQL